MIEAAEGWRETLARAWQTLDPDYRHFLETESYLPGRRRLLRAFETLPKAEVRYVLFGQDPYPRPASATGHAFIDGAVQKIFSATGLSREVNRATSLRNFIKMALVAEGALQCDDTGQVAIAAIDRHNHIDTIEALRNNFEHNGVLLLNTALVFTDKRDTSRHAKAWRPFVRKILCDLDEKVELILFGTVAKTIAKFPESRRFRHHTLEHPYNHTFVCNPTAHTLFGPMRLLQKRD